jgi:hypothetical protein
MENQAVDSHSLGKTYVYGALRKDPFYPGKKLKKKIKF